MCREDSQPSPFKTDVSNQPQYEVADILHEYLEEYLQTHNLSSSQRLALRCIMKCRTSKLGTHKLKCSECGYEQIEYKGRIGFRHLQEYDDGLLERLNMKNMSKIVFLKKRDKAGEYLASEFSKFTYSEELHKALIDFAER